MIFSDVKRKQTSRSKHPTAIINLRAKLTSTVFCTWILHDAHYQITRPESFRCQIWHFYSWEFFIIHRGNKKPVSKMKLRPELKVKTIIIKILNHLIQGADLGGRRGGGGGCLMFCPPSGIRPSADPKGPPLVLIWDIHNWLNDPKIFLKAVSAPICTKWSARRKNAIILLKFSKKCLKTKMLFWAVFFKILPAALKFGQNRVLVIARAQKTRLLDPPLIWSPTPYNVLQSVIMGKAEKATMNMRGENQLNKEGRTKLTIRFETSICRCVSTQRGSKRRLQCLQHKMSSNMNKKTPISFTNDLLSHL